MIKIATGLATAAAGLTVILAPTAAADTTPAPKPDPLSVAGLCHCNVPELSASGLLNGGKPYANPPLSAKGILGLLFPPGTIVKP
jgi:hypothetical protein